MSNLTATERGVRDAWDFWLSQHDVSVPDTIAFAVKEAFSAWLMNHAEDILREEVRAYLAITPTTLAGLEQEQG